MLSAQEAAVPQASPAQQPQVRVNYLNVCTPSEAEKAEIVAALKRVPTKPTFAEDFEVSRGRSSMDDSALVAGMGAQMSDKASVSRWVRIRKEFPDKAAFSNAQYSFSVGESRVAETLVFRVRDPKDLMQISITDSVDAPGDPAQVAGMNTPAERIRIERFGKSSVVLARCKDVDQSSYEPVFHSASLLLSTYRGVLGVAKTVPQDLARVPGGGPQATAKPITKKSATKKK